MDLRLRQIRKSLAAHLLLYPEARLPFGTLAAAQKIIGRYLDWKVASLCKRCAANRCIHNCISHSQTIGFPAPTRKYISRGILYLSDLGNVPPAAVFSCGFDPSHDVGVKYGAKLKQAAI
jgi:acetyl esterase/lipase